MRHPAGSRRRLVEENAHARGVSRPYHKAPGASLVARSGVG
jgi:hypothetical protein